MNLYQSFINFKNRTSKKHKSLTVEQHEHLHGQHVARFIKEEKAYSNGAYSLKLDMSIPENRAEAISKFEKIYNGAISPNNPSKADLRVAEEAQRILKELKE